MEIEKTTLDEELEQKRKLFVRNCIISILSLLSYFSILFYFLGLQTVSIVFFTAILLICYIYYIISKFQFDFKAFTDIGFAFFTFLIYAIAILFWKTTPIIYLFFLLVPLAVYVINGLKSTIYWSLFIVLLLISSPFVSNLLNFTIAVQFSNPEGLLVNFSIITWSVYLLIFFLYYHAEFEKIKRKQLAIVPSIKEKDDGTLGSLEVLEKVEEPEMNATEKDDPVYRKKYDELYTEIEHYFLEKKPYEDPNFNIHKLVIDLNSNSRYVFNAFHQKNGSSFKTYLNDYRIKEVKKKLDKKEHEVYTLKHIYTSVGFTNQSTFNRIFKEMVNLTPSEYIQQLK